MTLLEISVRTDGEAAEALSELFNRFGYGGAVIEEVAHAVPRNVVVKTYLAYDEQLDAKRRAIEEGVWHLAQIYPMPDPQFHELHEEDWANAWKQHHPVQHIGERIVLQPTWLDYEPLPHELVIHLDPGMAFGTGQHPSTRLSLLAIEKYLRDGMRVLDVGTGSGILAILAAKLGAREVFACDIDPASVEAARENAQINQVADKVNLYVGSLDSWHPSTSLHPVPARSAGRGEAAPHRTWTGLALGTFDLIVINILAPVIVALLPLARTLLRDNGRIILAGLIDAQADDVSAKMREVGLEVAEREPEGDWVMLVGQVVGHAFGSSAKTAV